MNTYMSCFGVLTAMNVITHTTLGLQNDSPLVESRIKKSFLKTQLVLFCPPVILCPKLDSWFTVK